MEKIINIIRQKSKECNKNTKEDRSRKGAYVDCIVLLESYQKDNSNYVIDTNKTMPNKQYISCPFCGENDFDIIGLKSHFQNNDCEIYNNTEWTRNIFK